MKIHNDFNSIDIFKTNLWLRACGPRDESHVPSMYKKLSYLNISKNITENSLRFALGKFKILTQDIFQAQG